MPERDAEPARKKTLVKPAPGSVKVGDRVRIRYHPSVRARVVELRGALGPGGARVYRLLLRRKPRPAYVEVFEDQIAAIVSNG